MIYQKLHFSKIDSTNQYLKENHERLENFTFVSSDYQTKGKGRLDRVWMSKEKENLLFSLLLKNKDVLSYGPFLSLVAAISVSEVLEEKCLLHNVQIKWPNDIYVNDKKICGILLEASLPDYLIIGIGINVNQKEFLGEYRKTPTSILLESGEDIDIDELKECVYDTIYMNISKIKENKERYLSYFNEKNYLKDKPVRFLYDGSYLEGIVVGVDENFNLILKSKEKDLLVSSGEIELLLSTII